MNKKRNLLLFGAGAVIDWKAPFTWQLTEVVKKSGFYTTDGKTTVTQFIYDKLKNEANYPENEINFETIINVIEELIVYYSNFNSNLKLISIPQIIFNSKFEEDIFNFSIEGGEIKHGYKLEIPKGTQSEFAKSAYNNETPEQFYLQQLLATILTDVVTKISKYSYHTNNHSNVITENNQEINGLFSNWIKQINSESILRMYTLNYDRNFKIILEKLNENFSIFEGFDCDGTLEYGSNLVPNLLKILSDTESNIHYNLHGSIFWKGLPRNVSQFPNPTFNLTEGPVYPSNSYEFPIWQSEKGKTIMVTNIVTGYQKTQRAIFSPFKQMQAAFDRDCCFADNIYIIGYSFGDEHINASIKNAIEYNTKVKFLVIEPSFTQNDFDLNVLIKVFSCAGDSQMVNAKIIEKDLHSFYDGKFIIHTKTFKKFLLEQ